MWGVSSWCSHLLKDPPGSTVLVPSDLDCLPPPSQFFLSNEVTFKASWLLVVAEGPILDAAGCSRRVSELVLQPLHSRPLGATWIQPRSPSGLDQPPADGAHGDGSLWPSLSRACLITWALVTLDDSANSWR